MHTVALGSRRAAALVLLVLLSACGGGGSAPSLPAARPWAPGPGEPAVEVKLAAARALEAVGAPGEDDARSRLVAAGLEPGFADTAEALLGEGEASLDVVYPQLAGLTATEAAVMAVVDVHRVEGSEIVSERRTVDVRLTGGDGAWRATAVAADAAAPSGGDPSAAALALVASPTLDLPVTAADDLRRGAVDERVVELLASWVADGRSLGVTVFSRGHPNKVFGTDRTSNHATGRAVDIWSVDGVAIAADKQSDTVRALVADAVAAGANEIGAPFDSDGPGGDVFTNIVHEDHLHLAFEE